MEPVTWNIHSLAYMPGIQAAILCFGTVLSFLISYRSNFVTIYLPFISETGAHGPSMNIFSLTLYLGSIAGCISISYRYFIMKYYIVHTPDKRLTILNKSAFAVGIICMFGLGGVAALPMSTILWAHLLAAGVHFVCAIVYIFQQTILNYYVPGSSRRWNRIRFFLGFFILIFLFLLVIFFPLSDIKWKEVHKQPPAMKLPEDEFFDILFASCLFEWLMVTTFWIYLFTFYFEFRKFRLVVGVVPASGHFEENNKDENAIIPETVRQ